MSVSLYVFCAHRVLPEATPHILLSLLLVAVLIVSILRLRLILILIVIVLILVLILIVFVFILIVLHNCLRVLFCNSPNYKIIICRSLLYYYIKRYFSSTSSPTRYTVRAKTDAKMRVNTDSIIHDISATMLSDENIQTLNGPAAAERTAKARQV